MSGVFPVPTVRPGCRGRLQRYRAKSSQPDLRLRRRYHGGQIRGRRRLRFARAPP